MNIYDAKLWNDAFDNSTNVAMDHHYYPKDISESMKNTKDICKDINSTAFVATYSKY